MMSINLKSTFTKTNNHVIIHSQLIVIRHNATTITYLHSSTYQLSQHICVSTIILKQDHLNTYSYYAIHQTFNQLANIPC